MNIWTFGADLRGPYNILMNAFPKDFPSRNFRTDGKQKTWDVRPKLIPYQEGRKKNKNPVADISTLFLGGVILNLKAYQVLSEYLSRFGQFLEAEFEGAPCYFYNVTEVVPCFDLAKCKVDDIGSVEKEAFDPTCVPKGEHIFKEPRRLGTDIYITAVTKEVLERMIQAAGLTGAEFVRVE